MTIAALLLDLDGTLVDSEPLHIRAHHQYLTSIGLTVSQADLLGNIGKGDEALYEELLARAGRTGDAGAMVAAKTDALIAIYRDEGLSLCPGVLRLLEDAWVEGLPALVVTSSERRLCRAALEAVGLTHRLPGRVTSDEVRHRKPAPDPYLLAASRLSLSPAVCLVIEDSPSGVRSAVAAGCRVVAVAGQVSGDHLRAAGAHRVVTSIEEVLPLAEFRT